MLSYRGRGNQNSTVKVLIPEMGSRPILVTGGGARILDSADGNAQAAPDAASAALGLEGN
jgi:hypothetical protein